MPRGWHQLLNRRAQIGELFAARSAVTNNSIAADQHIERQRTRLYGLKHHPHRIGKTFSGHYLWPWQIVLAQDLARSGHGAWLVSVDRNDLQVRGESLLHLLQRCEALNAVSAPRRPEID